MVKRLNSEKKITTNGFKVKIGTTNRLNPSTIYIDMGGFITPQENKEEYLQNVDEIDKLMKKQIKKHLINNNDFDKKYICVIETASERMKVGKKSYISLQCHLKQKSNMDVNAIFQSAESLTHELVANFNEIIDNNGFSTVK
jgi:hypothetical protein